MNYKLPKSVKITGIVLLIGVPLTYVGYLFLAIVFHIGNITPAQAHQKCQEFYDGVRVQLSAAPGYAITKSSKHCTPIQDELGSTDYNQSATFVVEAVDDTMNVAVNKNITTLANKLRADDFGLSLYNIPLIADRPSAICVRAYRYIDNNGEVYSQGNDGIDIQSSGPGPEGLPGGYEDCK